MEELLSLHCMWSLFPDPFQVGGALRTYLRACHPEGICTNRCRETCNSGHDLHDCFEHPCGQASKKAKTDSDSNMFDSLFGACEHYARCIKLGCMP